ncbi:hypothetical protein ACR3H8_19885 [Pseudomonas aeruginosa]|uniref:hypothetical protein n=1 Tax=Pseudomonas aeruginosa group TaxID=136841 RepID=UPI0003BB31CA|nr:hypothetical protein [Pseudomonas aeruginosa]ELD5772773.1 hypothetical protein [Pseudomonas aeruginosa]ERW61395.1 hypothetical protein Q024_06442 [Pseudomonas aeruginosa BWHPSA011]ETV28868.1 hypothetical protein Q046_05785 [Pseudomonas aeruginosa BWHPSA041]MBA5210109.1 hypothetical protein [Pseudomonas aeruginosa]MBG3917512.1 hypothetical protein [Pseudomonas aeruginosa]
MHPEIISHFTLIIGIILLLVAVTARKGFAHKIAKKPKGTRHAIQGLLALAVLTAGALIYHGSSLSN